MRSTTTEVAGRGEAPRPDHHVHPNPCALPPGSGSAQQDVEQQQAAPQQQLDAAEEQQQGGGGEQTADGGKAESGGWAGSPLHKKADTRLTGIVDKLGRVTPQMRCRPSFSLNVAQMVPAALGEDGGLLAASAHNLPCK